MSLVIRTITGAEELGLFTSLSYSLDHELADDLSTGRRRPEWMWLALREGRPVARLAWWSQPGAAVPDVLDFLDLDGEAPDRVEVGVRLLEASMAEVLPAGTQAPDYIRFIPPDWREDPEAGQVVADRTAVVERAGWVFQVERLRLEWRPGTPLAEPAGRLNFRPVSGREELIGLMTQVLDGTLDAHSQEDLTRMTPEEAAADHYDGEFAHYTSPRDWWQIAELPGGEPVGFVVGAHNPYNPVIAYIGVLPAHRGQGYIDDILAAGTRILAEAGMPRIRAATDLGNVPMARAFERAGYVNFERQITMSRP
ncbi:GNAT family N-acetyltransferase [Longispora albida]|uniref:GNAT family N-acetyltransferase n=1 Tax=Longispora albida TaxID=203523 RepID=UPI0003731FAC|nr:GNAT family N-acetyltransferase [Longispora albida]